jgi:prepilin-type N-terminal cleavage/methylation domain-containing protein
MARDFNNKGFTLIEVVIASVILFSAVAAASAALKSAVHAMAKIQATAGMAESIQPVCMEIKASLEKGNTSSSASLNKTISYSFTAQTIKRSKNLVSGSGFMTDGPAHGNFLLTLYQVDLEMRVVNSGRLSTHQYNYKELVWVKQDIPTLPGLPLSRS